MEGIQQPETRNKEICPVNHELFFFLMKEPILVLRAIDGICVCRHYGEKY